MSSKIVPNSVGWYILEGHPWWPVYICDVTKLRSNLHLLGNGHKGVLKKARDYSSDFTVVYYFGSHNFSLVSLKKGVLRPWDCPQKNQFLKGHPKHLVKKTNVVGDLLDAVHEAEEYLSQPEDVRLPQYMVPSDLDPTLEPPPQLMPQETDEEVETMDADDANTWEEEGEDDSDVEKKRKKKKKMVDVKKRKRTVDKKSASPAKIPKMSVENDVKSEIIAGKKDNIEKKPPPADMTMETLSILLEKEIGWILVNCVFEEMTTKTVRKLLEQRLKMELRHHKASIKEGVARVIASMEKEGGGDSASTAPKESTAASIEDLVQSDIKNEASETAAPVTPEAVVEDVGDATKEEAARTKKIESTKKELEAASKNLSLALDSEPKIMDALNSLKSLDSVDESVLAASTLQPRLVKLRAHRSSKICELVAFLVKKWDVEMVIPAPKSITKKEILDLKAKLENSEITHDELLATLYQLGEMALTIDHLKKTRLVRAVSKLRQHGNDKVSAKAHELRQKWIKQSNVKPADSDSGPNLLKTLKTLNRILGQQSDGTDEQKLERKQLAALEQLHSMSLYTKDIIDSKVGIPVSKLRKSSNEKVAKLATKLRKKWQAEAKA